MPLRCFMKIIELNSNSFLTYEQTNHQSDSKTNTP